MSLLFDPNHQLTMAAANAESLLKESLGSKTTSFSTNSNERKYRSRSRYGTEIEKLKADNFFGHNALSQRDEASLYSAIADEPLELLAVRAETFTNVLLQPFQEEFCSKAEFLSTIEFFSGWSPHLIRQLIFTLREKKYHPGECIFRQDVPTHCIYFIKSGSVKLSTHSNRKPADEIIQKIEPERDFLGEILAEDQPLSPKESQIIASISKVSLSSASRISIAASVSQTVNESKSTLNLPEISARRRSSLAPPALLAVAKKNSTKPNENEKKNTTMAIMPVHLLGFKFHEPCPESIVEICNLGPGELLGEMEAMCDLKHHLFNAACMTTTVVYEVDLFHIEQLLHKKAPRTLYSILQHIKLKVDSWQSRHSCVQFFEPLKLLLNQVDRKLTSEGANKPVRRQHNYNASTLALMATRSLGKPVLISNGVVNRNIDHKLASDEKLKFKDVNSRRFSLLYGCANPSSPKSTRERCYSTPPGFSMNEEPSSSPSPSPPSAEQKAIPKALDKKYHQSRQSSKKIKPLRTRSFSFDSPPPRQYRTKPNLLSSTRFPIPPPSPYPVFEDRNLTDPLMVENDLEDEEIETIKLTSQSPTHISSYQRCKSANMHQVCQRPTLSLRPRTAGPFSNGTFPKITINFLPPGSSTQSNKATEDKVPVADGSQWHQNASPSNVQVRGNSPKGIETSIVVSGTTTSDGEMKYKLCDNIVGESSTKEDIYMKEMKDRGVEGKNVRTGVAEDIQKSAISSNKSLSDVYAHQKQVRISEKLEFLGPKCQPNPVPKSIIVPMQVALNKVVQELKEEESKSLEVKPEELNPEELKTEELKPKELKTEKSNHELSKPEESNSENLRLDYELSQLDDIETTIPEEYMKLQPPSSSTASRPSSGLSENAASDKSTSAMVISTDQGTKEMTQKETPSNSAYTFMTLAYGNQFDFYQTRSANSICSYLHAYRSKCHYIYR